MKFIIEKMTSRHIDDVCEIENNSFTTPWSRNSIENELKNTDAFYFVATNCGKGVGYVGGWIVADQYDINNIAVLPSHRRKGIASLLLTTLIKFCKEKKLVQITLEVRESNTPAKTLYELFGFKKIGIRKKYYSDTGEDAVIMALEI